MSASLTGIILAGGENSRMNAPKALARVGGVRIIDRQLAAMSELFDDILVVSGSPGDFSGLGVRVVPDDEEFRGLRGPLTGVYTGLKAAGGDCFVVACDMPFLGARLISRLVSMRAGHDLVIPVVGGYAEPLFGVYGAGSLGSLRMELLRGGRRLQDTFAVLDVLYVGEDELERFDQGLCSFFNVNTPADLEAARELARRLRPAGRCGACT